MVHGFVCWCSFGRTVDSDKTTTVVLTIEGAFGDGACFELHAVVDSDSDTVAWRCVDGGHIPYLYRSKRKRSEDEYIISMYFVIFEVQNKYNGHLFRIGWIIINAH